jgi:hypothetical protein
MLKKFSRKLRKRKRKKEKEKQFTEHTINKLKE